MHSRRSRGTTAGRSQDRNELPASTSFLSWGAAPGGRDTVAHFCPCNSSGDGTSCPLMPKDPGLMSGHVDALTEG